MDEKNLLDLWNTKRSQIIRAQMAPNLMLIGIFECAVVAVQVIKGDIDNAIHLLFLQRSLQYLTSSQFLAHFLRHSKGR